MPKYNSFSNIIFDFGGVLLNIDMDRAFKEMQLLGIDDPNIISQEFEDQGLFDRLEKGEITPEEFRFGLRKYLKNGVTDKEMDQAWNSMLLDFPEERLHLLSELSRSHRLFLLSNTNKIHWDWYTASIKKEHGVWLPDLFEKDFYSFRMGLRKPDLKIFSDVIDEKDLNPADTLFIDDTLENVIAARKVGMNAHFLDLEKGETILDLV